MEFDFTRSLLYRFAEILVSCIVLSVTEVLLNIYEIVANEYLFPALLAGMILFLFINTLLQRQYYTEVLGNMLYYFGTLIPYAVFAVTSIAAYHINYKVYVLLFSITKFLSYYNSDITNMTSILIFHTIGFCVMSLSFVGLVGVTEDMKAEIMEEMDIQSNLTELEQGIDNNSAKGENNEKNDTEYNPGTDTRSGNASAGGGSCK